MRPRDYIFTGKSNGWEPFTVNCHFLVVGCHWSSLSPDITYLICHVTSQDQNIEASSNLYNWELPIVSDHLSNLISIDTAVEEML